MDVIHRHSGLFSREMGYAACPLNRPDFQNSTVANRQREAWPPGETHVVIAPMPVLHNYFSISVNFLSVY